MKVTVFGAGGFVGINLVEALINRGIEVVATDLHSDNIPADAKFIKANVTNLEAVNEVIKGCDVVIHLAASPLTSSLKNPIQNAEVNVKGTLNILESCKRNNSFLIFSSASSVVGEVLRSPVDEDHPCTPKTPYAASKLACEHYIRIYHQIFNVRNIVFRFFNLYGPWQFPESGGLIPNILLKLSKDESITVFGDGSAVRDYIYVGDVANLIIQSLEKGVENEVVNMGTGVGASIMDVLRVASGILNKEPKIEFKPKRPGEISNFVADTKKLRLLIGEAKIDLDKGLRQTYEWMKSNCIL